MTVLLKTMLEQLDIVLTPEGVSDATCCWATSNEAGKTGADTTSLNAYACVSKGFSSISREAEYPNKVAESESVSLRKSA